MRVGRKRTFKGNFKATFKTFSGHHVREEKILVCSKWEIPVPMGASSRADQGLFSPRTQDRNTPGEGLQLFPHGQAEAW